MTVELSLWGSWSQVCKSTIALQPGRMWCSTSFFSCYDVEYSLFLLRMTGQPFPSKSVPMSSTHSVPKCSYTQGYVKILKDYNGLHMTAHDSELVTIYPPHSSINLTHLRKLDKCMDEEGLWWTMHHHLHSGMFPQGSILFGKETACSIN